MQRILMLWLAALACVGDGIGLDSVGNPPGPGDGSGDPVTLSRDVQPMLNFYCTGCHAGTQPAQDMNLSAGLSHANTVDVPSVEVAGMRRVRPLQPDSSYLMHKVQGTHTSVGGSGDRMPLGLAPLTDQEIGLIRSWILLGAKNN